MPDSQLPPIHDVTPERRDRVIETLAQRICKAGMGSAAILFLEAHKPLGRLAGNALHFFSPPIGVFLPTIDEYAYLLQEPENIEILLMRLQEIEEERGRQQKALRAERKARARERKMRARGLPSAGEEAGTPAPEAGTPPDESGPKDGKRPAEL